MLRPTEMGTAAQLHRYLTPGPRLRRPAVWIYRTEIRPQLAAHGIHVSGPNDLSDTQNAFLDKYFDRPGLSGTDARWRSTRRHPFPHLHNKSLNLILRIETIGQDPPPSALCGAAGPSVLNRLAPLPDEGDGKRRFVLLEDVIGPRLDALFGGFKVAARGCVPRHLATATSRSRRREVKSSLPVDDPGDAPAAEVGAAVRLEISDRADEGFLAHTPDGPRTRPRRSRRLQGLRSPVDLTALVRHSASSKGSAS